MINETKLQFILMEICEHISEFTGSNGWLIDINKLIGELDKPFPPQTKEEAECPDKINKE